MPPLEICRPRPGPLSPVRKYGYEYDLTGLVSEALFKISRMKLARNRLSWAGISWPVFAETFQCRYVCPHFSSCLLLSLPASPLVILHFHVGMFPSIRFDFVLLLEYLLFPLQSVLLRGCPLFLPLPANVAFRILYPASYRLVLITLLSKHCLSRRNCFTHVKLQNISGNAENCPLRVTFLSQVAHCIAAAT